MKTVQIPSGMDLTALYRQQMGDYPKFFKMDTASKLGVLLAEMLVQDEPDRFQPRQDRAVLVFSRSGSLADDTHFAASMEDFPSPAHFVYTLPNTVTGEIAIRNKYQGETSAFVLEAFDPGEVMNQIVLAFQDKATRSVLALWIDAPSDEEWTAQGWLIDLEELLAPPQEHHCCHGGGHGGGCCGRHHHAEGEEHHCCHHGEEGGEHHCCHHGEEGGEHHCHCHDNNKENE